MTVRTYVVLLWIGAGEGQRPNNNPLLLLKWFHQQDPTLLRPAGETRSRQEFKQRKQTYKQWVSFSPCVQLSLKKKKLLVYKLQHRSSVTWWDLIRDAAVSVRNRPHLCRALAVQYLRFLSGSLTCPSLQHWPHTNFIFRLSGRPLPAIAPNPPTPIPPTGLTPPPPMPSPPSPPPPPPIPPTPPAGMLLLGCGMWIGWKHTEREEQDRHILAYFTFKSLHFGLKLDTQSWEMSYIGQLFNRLRNHNIEFCLRYTALKLQQKSVMNNNLWLDCRHLHIPNSITNSKCNLPHKNLNVWLPFPASPSAASVRSAPAFASVSWTPAPSLHGWYLKEIYYFIIIYI